MTTMSIGMGGRPLAQNEAAFSAAALDWHQRLVARQIDRVFRLYITGGVLLCLLLVLVILSRW